MYENGYNTPGQDQRVLDLAGLLRFVPFGYYYDEQHPLWVEWSIRREDVDIDDPGPCPKVPRWIRCWFISFEPIAPTWSIWLARKLMDDQVLVSKLGGAKTEERTGNKWARIQKSLGVTPNGLKLVLDVQERARILRRAASSDLASEMFQDDPLAAALIARDA
jgi:hypothetical protein